MAEAIDGPPAPVRATGHVRGAGVAGRLILTLLGDYWFAGTAFVPSSVLVDLAGELGASEAAGRAALSRLARDGWLEGARSGRTTAYRLAPAVTDAARRAARSLAAFALEPLAWDGRWTCVAFSLPAGDRRRRALQRGLEGAGLAPLFDELWIAPCADPDDVRRAVAGVADGAVVFRATPVETAGGADLLSPWDVDAATARYDGLVAWAEGVRGRLADGSLAPAEALRVRTELTGRWRALVDADPRLPDDLLPDPAPRRAARHAYVETYDGLGPLAEIRVRQVAGDRVPAGARPRCHTVAAML